MPLFRQHLHICSSYLIAVLSLAVLTGCERNSADVTPRKILLEKIEYLTTTPLVYLPGSPTDGIFKVSAYTTFAYDDKNRLVSEQSFSPDQPRKGNVELNKSFSLRYGKDGKINQIRDEKSDLTVTYAWEGSRVTATRVVNGDTRTAVFVLNDAGLPTKRTIENSTKEVAYDKNENVTEIYDNGLLLQNVEHDMARFNPYTTSYELRIFFNLYTDEGFIGRSRNWVLKTKDSYGFTRSNGETIVESNAEGYPTLTKTGSERMTKYYYVTK